MSVAIGIDLGTTNTVVAAVVDGVAVTLGDETGRRLLPSVVSFHPSSIVLVGEAARERRIIDPENTIFSVKPLLGRPWDGAEVQGAKARFPFKLVQGPKNSTMVHARDVAYALPEISAFVLRRAKAIAEAALGQPVDRAVITVPANFNDLQRASTKIAGKLAGLDVMRIMNEPTAAALAYGQSISKAEKIGVYDLGGGTFDVTLLDLTDNVFEVLATAGDTALGGDDIDRALAEKIALDVVERFNVDPRTNPASAARLVFMAEELKRELSTAQRAQRELTGVGHREGGRPIVMPVVMTREEIESLAKPLLERTIDVARQSIELVGLSPRQFDRVILVGGSTRMPLVVRMVEQLFGQPPHLKVNPDEVVALGAAIQAHALNRSKAAHTRRAAHGPAAKGQTKAGEGEQALGRPPGADLARAPANVPRAPALPMDLGAPAPPPSEPAFFTFDKAPAIISFSEVPEAAPARPHATDVAPALSPPAPDLEAAPACVSSPNVPELAAHGPHERGIVAAPDLDFARPFEVPSPSARSASDGLGSGSQLFRNLDLDLGPPLTPERFHQGSAIAASASTPLLIDVTPLSLGVETAGGYADVLIPANSPVPCEKTRTFLTASDGQVTVSIRVAQGESSRFAENTRLGDLELSGLRRARRGEVKIAVTFELDADGILNVRARDQDTGRETAATMRLLGTHNDAEDIGAMAERQARHHVA